MNDKPIFASPAQAIEVMYGMLARLSALVMWTLIALVHLSVLLFALVACWAAGVTAQDVATAYLQMRQTMPAEVLSFLGVSAASLLAGWLWVLRSIHRATGATWLMKYLLKGQ